MDTRDRRPLLLTLITLYEILSNSGVISQYTNYRRGTALSNNDNCICFENPTSDTLDKVLDPDDKGLDRLVIYVYKDPDDQIKTYVPNVKKQLNFPDFPFEDGDIINPNPHNTISIVFNTSLVNVVTVNPKPHKPNKNNKPKFGNPKSPTDYENVLFPSGPNLIGPIISILNETVANTNDTHTKTFNQWFDKEIKNVPEPLKSNPVDISTLEDLVQTILTKHGIKITSKGILTDSRGNVLDITELHLRPVLIGDPLEYDKVKNKSKKTFNVPSNLPYLEALLITLQHPPRVLGIIPLRKKYIPSKNINHENKKNPEKKKKDNTDIDSILKLIQQLTNGDDRDKKPKVSDKQKIIDSIPKVEAELLKLLKQHTKIKPTPVKATTKRIYAPTPTPTELAPTSSTEKYCAVCEQIRQYYNGDSSYYKRSNSRSDDDAIPIALNSPSILTSLVGKVVDQIILRRQELGEVVKDLEGPDFRIIGGAAATGSGSPISNRGRSGFIK